MSDVEIYKRVQRTTTGKRVVTWIWVVKCDGEIIASGPENTKRDAKKMGNRAAEDLCYGTSQNSNGEYEGEDGKIYNVEILPPAINASIANGHLDSVAFPDPWTDEYSSFTSNEISENELSWILGLIIPMQTDHPIPMQCDHPIPMQTDHPIPMQCDHPIPV